jgi:hypothetical protein
MCCGSRRSAWRSAPAPSRLASNGPSVRQDASGGGHLPAKGAGLTTAGASVSAQGPFPTVTLDYLESAAIRVRGPITGRPYEFSKSQPSQAVDVRDAAVFARNSSFRQSRS